MAVMVDMILHPLILGAVAVVLAPLEQLRHLVMGVVLGGMAQHLLFLVRLCLMRVAAEGGLTRLAQLKQVEQVEQVVVALVPPEYLREPQLRAL